MDARRRPSGRLFDEAEPAQQPQPVRYYRDLAQQVLARGDWLPVPRELVRRLGSGPAVLLCHLLTIGKMRSGDWIPWSTTSCAVQLGRPNRRIALWLARLLGCGILQRDDTHIVPLYVRIDSERLLEYLDG